MGIDTLLTYIQRTNPQMTEEKLVEELCKSDYAAKALVFTADTFCCGKISEK